MYLGVSMVFLYFRPDSFFLLFFKISYFLLIILPHPPKSLFLTNLVSLVSWYVRKETIFSSISSGRCNKFKGSRFSSNSSVAISERNQRLNFEAFIFQRRMPEVRLAGSGFETVHRQDSHRQDRSPTEL